MFNSCTNLESVSITNASKCTNMQAMFYYCTNLTSVSITNASKCTNMSSMFNSCTNLTSIPQLDTSSATDMSSMFYKCTNLTDIDMYGMKVSFDLSYCTKLSRDVLVKVFGNLATITSTQTLTLGSTLLALLSDDDKAIATSKGWTLA